MGGLALEPDCDDEEAVEPFLRWAGSKRLHVPFLSRFWSGSFTRYVEPFAGSAALFFALDPPDALLGDLNSELIQTLRAVAKFPARVSSALQRLPRGESNYYRIRGRETQHLSRASRAARFIYLNRFCFNGIFRTNTNGAFNVPYGAPKNDNVPTLLQLKACGERLRRATIIHADFRTTLARVGAGDLVYLDPPYAVGNRRVFIEYGKSVFNSEDLSELGELLVEIEKRGAHFVVSYADCGEARETFSRWSQRRIPVRRNIAGFVGARRKHYELYASNCDRLLLRDVK